MKCIKDKDMNILVQNENIEEYFDELFIGEQGNVVGDTTITP